MSFLNPIKALFPTTGYLVAAAAAPSLPRTIIESINKPEEAIIDLIIVLGKLVAAAAALSLLRTIIESINELEEIKKKLFNYCSRQSHSE